MAGVVAGTLLLVAAPGADGAGHAPRRVPNVVGLPKPEVYAAMRRAQLYFVTRGPGSADGAWRSAAALRPRAGATVAWHSTVVVTVSMAPGHVLVRVPRLVGRTRAQVYAAMRRAQLFFVTRGPGSVTGRWVVVTAQRPRAGTPVRWHTTVTLGVSTRRPVRHHPTTTTTRPRRTTTTTRPPPAPTTSSTTPPTTYPGETTTTGATTTTAVTTTTRPAPATRPRPKPHRYRIGVATWYNYIPGRCATSYLPFGTRIHVRDLRNGRTITCVVTDREGHESRGSNRVVDLSETQFAELAPLRVGVIPVKVSW